MKTILTELSGVIIIEPEIFSDDRGCFFEAYNMSQYQKNGIMEGFVQDNISISKRGTLRGLHFQNPHAQGKLVSVLSGEAFDVVVDIRVGSLTFGKWISVILNNNNKRQFYIPPGLAHGFLATADDTIFCYKCSDFYNSQTEANILWNDPELGIAWPIKEPIISEKDSRAHKFADYSLEQLPKFIKGGKNCKVENPGIIMWPEDKAVEPIKIIENKSTPPIIVDRRRKK